jgi:hypothetical protein
MPGRQKEEPFSVTIARSCMDKASEEMNKKESRPKNGPAPINPITMKTQM